jgi:PST family polysaccharide transporter/lipopolysaccharide exporter
LGGAILVFARPIITIVMGTQWDAAIPAVQILAVYGILRTFFGNFAPLFLSVGKQSYVAQMTAARLIGLAIFIIPSINHFGLIGAGYAMLASIFFEIPIALYFIRKVLY